MEMSINIERPFESLYCQEWEILADYSDSATYNRLDRIYQYLQEGGEKPEFCKGMTDADIFKLYSEEFPKMMGEALKDFADDLIHGDVETNMERN